MKGIQVLTLGLRKIAPKWYMFSLPQALIIFKDGDNVEASLGNFGNGKEKFTSPLVNEDLNESIWELLL